MSHPSGVTPLRHQQASVLGHNRAPVPQHHSNYNPLSCPHSATSVEQTQSPSSSTTRPTTPSSSHHRIRRRNRMITSCLECRRRKLKCDKLHPCTNCAKSVRDCVFLAPATDQASQLKMAEIKEKMGVLERDLEIEVANANRPQYLGQNEGGGSAERACQPGHGLHGKQSGGDLPGSLSYESSDEDGDADVPADEKDLEPTPLAVVDAAWDDDADDEILDLGVKMGRMRLTERLGGYFRPKIGEELDVTLNLSEMNPRFPHDNKKQVSPLPPVDPSQLQSGLADRDSFLEPGPTYIAPGSGFYFGSQSERSSILDFLPSRPAGDRLITQYHHAVHVIARVLHWPTFQTQYENFWAKIVAGIEPPGSLQAVVFAVMHSAVVSMGEDDVTGLFSVPKKNLMATFQSATELAFGRANFLRTTKLETLQALVIYLIPMCRAEISRAHSVLLATAIRLAECMGLHRDPQQTYGLGPLESHARRILWYQLCFLDIRTAEAQGPQPSLRRDDFDTSCPRNVNDADLLGGNQPAEVNGWTDMTFSKMRFECNEMHRVVWVDRKRLERKQVSLTHVLGKIESFRKAMEAKYHPIFDEGIPVQKAAMLVMSVLLLRMHIMVLHLYRDSLSGWLPERIRQTILTTGTQLTEDAVRLDIDPELQPWSWYTGAYQQWHTAVLLLLEIFAYPERREADRIWRILDHVFETNPAMTMQQKGRAIISELRDRTDRYRAIRKMRPPVSMMHRLHADQMREQEKRSNSGQTPDSRNERASSSIQSFERPLQAHHPTTSSDGGYANPASAGYEKVDQRTHHHSAHGQARDSSPFYQSSTVPAADPHVTSAAANLGHITKAYAEAPSPIYAGEPPKDPKWTFDAPATMFALQTPINKSYHGRFSGEEIRQDTPHPTETTGSSESLPSGGAGLLNTHGAPLPVPNGEYIRRNMGMSDRIPVSAAGQPFGVVAPNNNGGGLMQMQSQSIGFVPPSGRGPGPGGDVIMQEIDWSEWDKIFPPGPNSGIIHAALPRQV